MPLSHLFKRRQLLTLSGVGAIGFLGGGAVTAGVINAHAASENIPVQIDEQPYINPGTFNQQFLTKKADIRQIWDFATYGQVQSDGGFTPIKNAMNAFQFIYKKNLYPVICLRGSAVIYALDDETWSKYGLSTLYGQKSGSITHSNPVYRRFTTDNGTLNYQDRISLYQDSSLQALVERGSSIAACHDALNGVSSTLATQKGLTAQVIFNELAAHLVPGTQQTPSGSSLIAVAQHLGFTYATQ